MNINSSYRKVWFARLISILGTGLTSFGVSVWVYTVTGKATPMVLILLFSILPAIFLAPFSGYLCDKYNRKAIIICADSIAALISVFIYICVSYYEFNYFVLCVFTFLDSCANFFDNNAYQASITTLVSPDEVKTANGMSQIIDSLDSIASPMLLGYRMGVSCNSLFQSRNSYETDYTRALTILQAWYQFAASGFDFPHSNG